MIINWLRENSSKGYGKHTYITPTLVLNCCSKSSKRNDDDTKGKGYKIRHSGKREREREKRELQKDSKVKRKKGMFRWA